MKKEKEKANPTGLGASNDERSGWRVDQQRLLLSVT